MRKELGKPAREYFFKQLATIAPGFKRCSTPDIKGFTWSFLRREGDLYQWLWFQRRRDLDAFTVEIAWSCLTDHPTDSPFKAPEDSFTQEGARLRLGAFWNRGGDHWWYATDPPPGILDVSPEEYLAILSTPPVVDLSKALPRVLAAVDDAVARIQEYALPYFSRVAAWAQMRDRRPYQAGSSDS